MRTKVLVAITTGRPIFRDTLDMLAANFAQFEHFDNDKVGLLINYDPDFQNLPVDAFFYDGRWASLFSEILYIGPNEVAEYAIQMRAMGLVEDEIRLLCQPRGFGHKKNLILLRALLEGYEATLFWDDDEYPVVCMATDANPVWRPTDVLSAHLGEITSGADVTSGFWSGHVYPTVPGINEILRHGTAELLGEALSLGTETHSKASFVDPNRSFSLGHGIPEVTEIPSSGGGKWVSGGNVCIRVPSVTRGVVPPFYTPQDSRGDDTMFSMQLSRARVMQVPSGAFHDMYLDFPEIGRGKYPQNVGYIPANIGKYLVRFASGLKAWLAYAPLFIRLKEGAGYDVIIRKMLDMLQAVDRTLFLEFPLLGESLNQQRLSDIFAHYARNLESQYRELQRCYAAWHQLCSKM